MHSMIRRTGALAATAALALGLVSCSGGGQSTADACQLAEDTMSEAVNQTNSDAQTALQNAMQGEEVDFSGIFKPVNDALQETQKKVTNPEVKEALDEFVAEYAEFTGLIEGVDFSAFSELSEMSNLDPSDPAAMEKLEELQKSGEEMQAAAEELQTKMQDQQGDLMDASQKLAKLCGA